MSEKPDQNSEKREQSKDKAAAPQPKAPNPQQKQAETQKAPEAAPIPLDRVFARDDIFPDATGLMCFQPTSLDEALQKGLVVPDTNVLLLLYKTESRSIEEISKLYRQLARERRLRMPGQVAREFVSHRGTHLLNVVQAFERAQSAIGQNAVPAYPFLQGHEKYDACHKTFEALAKQLSELRKMVGEVKRSLAGESWNDPVSALYRECFTPETCVDPSHANGFNRAKAFETFLKRCSLKVPPGYKDSDKDDGGIGDYLIWLAIIEIGTTEKTPLIFVSGDEKNDWMDRMGKQGVFPRFELVDEYRRASQGNTFFMMQMSTLLDAYGVSAETVKEVERLEESIFEEAERQASQPISESIAVRSSQPIRQPFNLVTELTKQLSGTMNSSTAYSEALKQINENMNPGGHSRVAQGVAQEIERMYGMGRAHERALAEVARQFNEQNLFGKF